MSEPPVLSLVERLAQPNQSVLETLRPLLEAAEKGEIVNVAVAWVDRDGSSASTWSAGPHAITLVGAVAMVLARLTARLCPT